MSFQKPENRSQKKSPRFDVSSMPFGVGEYPAYILNFFNWGAFSQPFLWGVIYGIWPIVLVVLAADVVPYTISYFMMKSSPDSIKLLFYSLIVQLLCTTIARLYAGLKANQFVWTREAMVVKMIREGNPRWDMNHYLTRQLLWAKYGMFFYGLAAVASAYVYYTAIGPVNMPALVFATILPLIWFSASVLAGRQLSRQQKVQISKTGIVTETPNKFFEELRNQPSAFENIPHFHINTGTNIPAIGFGTYKITDEQEVVESVKCALKTGYRLIDTAAFYENERAVGRAIKESGIPRTDLFIASKVWQDQQGYAGTVLACEEILSRLGVEYLDLYLVHWPVKSKMAATWKAMEHLLIAGKVKAIGVCNFEVEHLEELKKVAHIKPAVNQIELHPEFVRDDIVAYCAKEGIQVEAWAPLARGHVFDNETLKEVGTKYEKTAGQVALRWAYQRDIVVIPKSTHEERIIENFEIFDFELTDEDMQRIADLDSGMRLGPDPKTFSWEWPKSSRN